MPLIIVDDKNTALKYSSGWSQSGIQAEFQQGTSWPSASGSTVSYSFYGRSIEVVGTFPARAVSAIVSFQLDSVSQDVTTPANLTAALTHQTFFKSDNLDENKEHQLTMTMKTSPPTGSNGLLFLDYLLYEPSSKTVMDDSTQYFVDDRDSSLTFEPSTAWETLNDTYTFRNTLKNTTTKGASVTYSFTGSSISVYGRLDNSTAPAKASFTIDSASPIVSQYSQQSQPEYNHQLFLSDTLDASKEHTLKIEYDDGQDPLNIDYLIVNPGKHSSRNNSLSGGTIAGIVVGCIVGVALITGLLFWWFRRRRNFSQDNEKSRYSISTYAQGSPLSPSTFATPYHTAPSTGGASVSRRPTAASSAYTTGGEMSYVEGVMDISPATIAQSRSSYDNGSTSPTSEWTSTGLSSSPPHAYLPPTQRPLPTPVPPIPQQAVDSGYRDPSRPAPTRSASRATTAITTATGSKRDMMLARLREDEERRELEEAERAAARQAEIQPPAYSED